MTIFHRRKNSTQTLRSTTGKINREFADSGQKDVGDFAIQILGEEVIKPLWDITSFQITYANTCQKCDRTTCEKEYNNVLELPITTKSSSISQLVTNFEDTLETLVPTARCNSEPDMKCNEEVQTWDNISKRYQTTVINGNIQRSLTIGKHPKVLLIRPKKYTYIPGIGQKKMFNSIIPDLQITISGVRYILISFVEHMGKLSIILAISSHLFILLLSMLVKHFLI